MGRADTVLENHELRIDQAIQAQQEEIDELTKDLGAARDRLIALQTDKVDIATARSRLARSS